MLRVYIDDFIPPIWEVDAGPGTASRKFENVVAESVGVYKYDLSADNTNEPKAWVEYPDGELKIINHTALIRDHFVEKEDLFILR